MCVSADTHHSNKFANQRALMSGQNVIAYIDIHLSLPLLFSNFLIIFFYSHHSCFHCFHVFVPSLLCHAFSSNLPLPLPLPLLFSNFLSPDLINSHLLFPCPSSSPHLLSLHLLSTSQSPLLIFFLSPIPLVADMSRCSRTSTLMKMKQPSMCAPVHV